jgi:hypothetical protein
MRVLLWGSSSPMFAESVAREFQKQGRKSELFVQIESSAATADFANVRCAGLIRSLAWSAEDCFRESDKLKPNLVMVDLCSAVACEEFESFLEKTVHSLPRQRALCFFLPLSVVPNTSQPKAALLQKINERIRLAQELCFQKNLALFSSVPAIELILGMLQAETLVPVRKLGLSFFPMFGQKAAPRFVSLNEQAEFFVKRSLDFQSKFDSSRVTGVWEELLNVNSNADNHVSGVRNCTFSWFLKSCLGRPHTRFKAARILWQGSLIAPEVTLIETLFCMGFPWIDEKPSSGQSSIHELFFDRSKAL